MKQADLWLAESWARNASAPLSDGQPMQRLRTWSDDFPVGARLGEVLGRRDYLDMDIDGSVHETIFLDGWEYDDHPRGR